MNYAYEDTWSLVQDNIIQYNREGIYAHWINYNEITGNTIQFNSETGLEMERCEFSSIKGNIISDNGDDGIHLRGASHSNVIDGCNIISNNSIGIKITESNKNRIANNNFIDNCEHAYIYNAFLSKWRRNYFDDRPLILPKIIKGHIGHRKIPYLNIDWFSRRRPYELPE